MYNVIELVGIDMRTMLLDSYSTGSTFYVLSSFLRTYKCTAFSDQY